MLTRRNALLFATVIGLLGWSNSSFAQVIPDSENPLLTPLAIPQAPPASSGVVPAGWTGNGVGLLNRIPIGAGTAMPDGCSCFAAERTFLFGNCRQFFTPGQRCGSSLFGGKCFGRCATPAPGTGGLGDHQPCAYGSNLNR